MPLKGPFYLLALVLLVGGWSATICFVERTRTIEGTWVDLQEGSSLFEKQTIAEACSPSFDEAPWFAYYPPHNTPAGALVKANRGAGRFVSTQGTWPVSAYSVVFVGRRKVSELLGLAPLLGIGYGHLGASGSQFEVDRVLSIKPIANVHCDVR